MSGYTMDGLEVVLQMEREGRDETDELGVVDGFHISLISGGTQWLDAILGRLLVFRVLRLIGMTRACGGGSCG